MSTTTSPAPTVCYTVTITINVHGTPREHVAARNLLYHDAAAIVDDCIDRGIDVRMTPQPTTPFTVWTPPAH